MLILILIALTLIEWIEYWRLPLKWSGSNMSLMSRRHGEWRCRVGGAIAGIAGGRVRGGGHLPAVDLGPGSFRPPRRSGRRGRGPQLPQPVLPSRRLPPVRVRLPAGLLRKRLQRHGWYSAQLFHFLQTELFHLNLMEFSFILIIDFNLIFIWI